MAPRASIPATLKGQPFTVAEAQAAGLSATALRGKSWRRVARGLYSWAGLTPDALMVLRAWQRAHPDTVYAGRTAAWLHGLDTDPLDPIEVVAPLRSGLRSRNDITVRRCLILKLDVATVRGLRATGAAQTFRDLGRSTPRVERLILADAALRAGLGCFDPLAEPAESAMETRLRWLLLKAGMPRPSVQRALHDAKGTFVGRADLYYEGARLVVEFDGGNHRDRLVEDNRRQNLLTNARPGQRSGCSLRQTTNSGAALKIEL